MGKRGPAPQPTAILQLHGSRRAKTVRKEPEPPVGIPDVPENTPAAALEVWRKAIEHLLATKGLLTRIDGPQLERYARYFVRWRLVEQESELMIARAGSAWQVLGNQGLRPALRGLWAESRRLDQAMKEIEGNFGMSPADRRRIGSLPEDKPQMPLRMKPPA